MTNEELDRWLAERVMGWTHQDIPGYKVPCGIWKGSETEDLAAYNFRVGAPGNDYYECKECDWWHPTTNISQAIKAAEKALKDRRIERWFIGRSIDGMPNRGVEVLDGPVIIDSRGEMDDAEFLCRAIYRAMMDDS